MRPNRRGFTLIEVLIAMGIIATLAAMIFLGFKYVGKSARTNRGEASLQTLKGVLTEYEQMGGRMSDLYAIYGDLPNGQLPAPTKSVAEGSSGERFGEATIRTQRVMRRLMAIPAVKSAIDNMPKEAMMQVESQAGVKYFPGDEVIVPAGGGMSIIMFAIPRQRRWRPGAAGNIWGARPSRRYITRR